ncbi:hypothetical protein ACQEV9_15560 [Streptomyces chartreusis]|uniref:hypothetical protein n=1 Tax=Streptomyces chartreusis TaxID=1969 RepID=UPI003D8C961E
MKFSRTTSATGTTQYIAEGESFRYMAERAGKEWTLTLRRLETVAGIRVAEPGTPYWETTADTLSLCKSIATEFEALGDDYRSADYGHRDRVTEAVLRAYDTTITEGETMAETKTETTETDHAATVEQIEANIERASSLAEAENAEGLAELNKETETLISSLPSRGRFEEWGRPAVTFAALKKSLRGNMRQASQAQAKPEPKAQVVKAEPIVPAKYTDFEGVEELVTLGAERVAEGVRLHLRTSEVAQEIAKVALDIARSIPNKDGNPDIMVTSQQARDAMGALYRKAGEGFERTAANEKALKSLQRSVQYFRGDVRGEFLKSLDGDSADAAEDRAAFAKVLENKPEDVAPSVWVAKQYGTALKGQAEIDQEEFEAKELGSGAEGESEQSQAVSVDEKLRTFAKRVRADVVKVTVDDFEQASDETKEAIRQELEETYEALKAMIKATI